MEIFFSSEGLTDEIATEYEQVITKALTTAAKLHNLPLTAQVSVSLVGDQEIQEINRDYRGIDKITDVISFALDEGEEFTIVDGPQEQLLGEIVISLPQTLRQAKEYENSVERELAYLTVHGFLHLLGYDHMNEDDKALMRREEEKIMQLLGLTRV